MSETNEKFEGWAILELMGHRRLGGFVRETQIAGAGFLRIDIPSDGGANDITQFYPPSSLYGLTPVTEPMARAVARQNTQPPVSRWELQAATPMTSGNDIPLDDVEIDDDDDVYGDDDAARAGL